MTRKGTSGAVFAAGDEEFAQFPGTSSGQSKKTRFLFIAFTMTNSCNADIPVFIQLFLHVKECQYLTLTSACEGFQ